jgi:membrane fusion protein, multidrug efflux system
MQRKGGTGDDMRRWLAIAVLLAGLSTAAYFGIDTGSIPFFASPAPAPKAASPAIPVVASTVKRADVPIYMNGLGTVQAFNSVVVKSRVDGQIVKIHFTEGRDVKAGDLLVEIDPAPYEAALAQAKANKLKDEAQLVKARLDLTRAAQLAQSGSGSRQALETAEASVGQFEASVKADQAAIDLAQNQLSYTRIRSPIDGRAGTRNVDAGNIVRSTDAAGIVSVNQLHPIFVNFSLPADSLAAIRAKQKNSDVEVLAQDSNGALLATGKLSVIDNQINPATGTINYKATFDNDDEVLWPGRFVNARVEVDVRRNVVAVPIMAVQQGPDGPYAFVVGEDRVIKKRVIKVGGVDRTTAVIDDGLVPGELVVIDGQYRIQAGSRVNARIEAGGQPPVSQ